MPVTPAKRVAAMAPAWVKTSVSVKAPSPPLTVSAASSVRGVKRKVSASVSRPRKLSYGFGGVRVPVKVAMPSDSARPVL